MHKPVTATALLIIKWPGRDDAMPALPSASWPPAHLCVPALCFPGLSLRARVFDRSLSTEEARSWWQLPSLCAVCRFRSTCPVVVSSPSPHPGLRACVEDEPTVSLGTPWQPRSPVSSVSHPLHPKWPGTSPSLPPSPAFYCGGDFLWFVNK